ncbi:hypothetical protein Ppa06_62030 [Planomonospora parontospora subsp. parontospora]|uniref:Uncharacterized protein n=2 Tax=Planomonospora parontospora TaxID=58119 RepID=A0AA37BN32_9ACTN|nr:hypothetical protein [Planomonospora parontospora]GGK93818.1 hypothetical protein GCM10010126_61500 [Planomonospora parontospora]GII12405.1 hypothetical protein Ppa06_62030 [Planomonospora parontospora subsp. parontospora]
MNDRSEVDLARALATAAENAPRPAGDLLEAVQRRRARRTRRRVQSALAVAAVIAVAVGGTALARGVLSNRGGEGPILVDAPVTASPGDTAAPRDPEPSSREVPGEEIRPAAEVWPAAVSVIPAKTADGWRYRPVTALSATELLLTAESSFEKAGRLEVYDTAAGRSTVLTEMPGPAGVKGYYVQAVEPGAEYVAWWGETPNNGDRWADFWVAPRSGGTARRVGEVTGDLAEVERIGVTADAVVWSVKGGGVHRLPLTGGAPERIAGTDGLHLLSWPWAVDMETGPEAGGGDENQTRRVNLETGEVIGLSPPEGAQGLRCGPVWCFGQVGEGSFVQRADGSDHEVLRENVDHGGWPLIGDRFGLFRAPAGPGGEGYVPVAAVYDPVTGTFAGISAMGEDGTGGFGTGTSSSPPSIVYWDEGGESARTCRTDRPEGPAGASAHPEAGVSCSTTQKGGGKMLTVLNLLAVPKTE